MARRSAPDRPGLPGSRVKLMDRAPVMEVKVNRFGVLSRRRLPSAVHVIRVAAGPDDAKAVRALDDAAFPAGDPDVVRAAPGELEQGVAAGDVHVLLRDGRLVAYAHLDTSDPRVLYIAGFAVHPDLQHAGLGSLMFDRLMRERPHDHDVVPVTAVTSPKNHAMVSLLLHHGFGARWALPEFFGPGSDRFGFQLGRGQHEVSGPPAGTILPAARLEEVFSLVAGEGMVVREILRTESGPAYRLTPERPGEFLPCDPPRSGTDAAEIRTPET